MNISIHQKQNRSLLEEHAKSSYNFGGIGKNELLIAISFLIIGILISIAFRPNWLVGVPGIIIGLIEIVKYPTREKRWVRKKEKESIFNKSLEFRLTKNALTIMYDEESKTHRYDDMRACLISDTGILFKISWVEYYYISFNSFDKETNKQELITHLESEFDRK